MTNKNLSEKDYPIAENCPELVRGNSKKQLADLTLEKIESGEITIGDVRISSDALCQQAEIARASGREKLAENFDRGSEMVNLPQDVILDTYELLRPGRAKSKQILLDAANELRYQFKAEKLAKFIEEAADVYERRKLFVSRY